MASGDRLFMKIEFREVPFGSAEYKDLLYIRNEVLRRPIGMELRPKDIATDDKEFHLGAFDNGKAIGCVLLRPLSDECIQLRQMAVLGSHRGQNIGAKLVQFAEDFSRQKKYKTIETRARKTAEGFYKKLGYTSHAEKFEDEHTLMMKKPLSF
jgi:GNAT superfamily N-acetyltransferase